MTDIKTQGTQLKIENAASPNEYTLIPGVYQISGLGGGEGQEIDVTDFDSSAKEYLIGLKDEGTLSFSMNYNPDNAQHILLETLRDSQASSGFQIVLAAGTLKTFTFDAFVKTIDLNLDADDAVRATVALRITGAVVKS